MPFAETRDRSAIAARLRRNPRAHAYELGDLDDFDWPFTRWFGWYAGGELEEVVLLYTQPAVPVVLAVADDPDGPMTLLLEAIRDELPARIYVHVTPPLLGVLSARYAVEEAHPHLKLALVRTDLLGEHPADVDVLGSGHLDEITAFYDEAYPGTWFEPRLLATERYVGIRVDGRLACVAGVHLYSPAWSVAALGNVATLPGLRGLGLARSACAALCRLLLEDGIGTIALNVSEDNEAAIRAYTRLGFEPVAEYTEAALVVRG